MAMNNKTRSEKQKTPLRCGAAFSSNSLFS